jgi:RNA polymerase sigma-70 factor (ECF subfamily)
MAQRAAFPSTAWSLISKARGSATSEAHAALCALCEAYWYPLYSYARRTGASPEDASDLTQGYFALLLEKDYLGDVRLREGRFRAFLLTSFRNFMSKERDRSRAQKRGGGKPLLSIDVASGEARHVNEPSDDLTPEDIFERQWALTILERAMEGLRREAVAAGREAELACLQGYLTGAQPQASYAEAGAQLGMSEVAVRAMVLRLRRRYGRLLRAEIADTLADPEGVDTELRHLLSSVRPWSKPTRS